MKKPKQYKATMGIYCIPESKDVKNKQEAKIKAIGLYKFLFDNFDKNIETISKMIKIELRK